MTRPVYVEPVPSAADIIDAQIISLWPSLNQEQLIELGGSDLANVLASHLPSRQAWLAQALAFPKPEPAAPRRSRVTPKKED